MTATELRATFDRLGLSQTGAARCLEVEARTVRYWLAGDRPIPAWLVLMLDLMENVRGARERVLSRL